MFFTASKVFWILARPLTFLLFLLVTGIVLRGLGWRRAGTVLTVAAGLGLVVGEFTTLGAMLLAPLENRFPAPAPMPEAVTGIIVLGGAVVAGRMAQDRNRVLLNGSAERMTQAVTLARRYPEARLAFTGFSASLFPDGWSEADVARRFFTSMGVDQSRVIYEDAARNTAENARFLKAMLDPGPDETWLLVTSAVHMPRAMGSFRQAGWASLIPYPVDYRTAPRVGPALVSRDGLQKLNSAIREWIGLLAYWLSGRSPTVFPAPVSVPPAASSAAAS